MYVLKVHTSVHTAYLITLYVLELKEEQEKRDHGTYCYLTALFDLIY
jgi:hypothetical protein